MNGFVAVIFIAVVSLTIACHISDRMGNWPARNRRTSYDGDVIFSNLDWDD